MIKTEGIKKPKIHELEFPLFAKSVVSAAGAGSEGVMVELGTNKAKGSAAVMMLLNREGLDRKLYTIDICTGAAEALRLQREKFQGDLDVQFLLGSSHDPELAALVEEPVVWLWVDGCHCFDCVVDDMETWIPKMAPGGLVVFHDANEGQIKKVSTCQRGGGSRRRCGVAGAIKSAPSTWALKFVESGPMRQGFPGIKVYSKEGSR